MTCNLQKAEPQLTSRLVQDRPLRCEFPSFVRKLAELRFVGSNRHPHQPTTGTDNKFSGQVIDCSTTSSCSEVNINLNSTCYTDSTTWDNNFGGSIQAQIPLWFNKDASATGILTYDHSFGGAKDVQICTSGSDTGY